MGKSKRYDDDDFEARSERQPLPPLDPEKMRRREEYWRNELRRMGGAIKKIRRGGVYRMPGYDQDGRSISHEEELALDRAAGCEFPDDNPLLREREVFDPDDESAHRRPRHTPAELARREEGWRGMIGRHGRQDGMAGDVYRNKGYDHDGRPVSPEEQQRWEDSQGQLGPDDPTNVG